MDPLLVQYENPISGMVRILEQQTSLNISRYHELGFGLYHQHIVPRAYSHADEPVKVHFFQAVLNQGVSYENSFRGSYSVKCTNEQLLRRKDVSPLVRFILEKAKN